MSLTPTGHPSAPSIALKTHKTHKTLWVNTFSRQEGGGNTHLIVFHTLASQTCTQQRKVWMPRYLALSREVSPYILVIIYTVEPSSYSHSKNDPLHFVEFYQYGYSITRCGSGSLAAAKALSLHNEQDHTQNKHVGNVPLYSTTEKIDVGKDLKGLYFYRAPTLKVKPVPQALHALWAHIAPITNRSVYSSGPKTQAHQRALYFLGSPSDYCLMVLTCESDLHQLKIRNTCMIQFTRRALIAVAPSKTPSYDYALRYFAPQYGQNEDQATGSAHAQAAVYWQKRLGKRHVKGIQRFELGGGFLVSRDKQWQYVRGKAIEISSPLDDTAIREALTG